MKQALSLKARQIKAARSLLDWGQEQLAQSSGLSIATIRKIEAGFISPRGKTMGSIQRAFENVGIEFLEYDGVRRRPEEIRTYQGGDGLMNFLDDAYNSVKKKGGEIVSLYDLERPFEKVLSKTDDQAHIERMTRIKDNFSFKCLLKEPSKNLACAAYCEYRYLAKQYVDSVSFYVYDDVFASILFDADPSPKIIAIRSQQMAQAYRRQFYSMWDKATPLNEPRKQSSRRSV